jgi:peptidoglycan hydrolase-like protein with peptidoglycan-binding domain
MLLSRASLAFLLAASVAAASAFATPTHKKSSSPHARSARTSPHTAKAGAKSRKGSKSRRTKLRGQQGIDSSRASEIQQALIREHYLTGEPTGQWDSATISAMQKFQGDQGWQTKLTPDSRALKKLGLGPDYSNAINASGSSFADPKQPGELPSTQAAGFAAASGVNR